MNTKATKERLYEVDGEYLTKSELGLALYHISRNTQVSRDYTLKFVSDALLRASELLLDAEPVSVLEYGEESDENVSEEALKEQFEEMVRKEPPKTTYCAYHNTHHMGSIDHQCPADPDINCGCCEAGKQACMKKKLMKPTHRQWSESWYLRNKNVD